MTTSFSSELRIKKKIFVLQYYKTYQTLDTTDDFAQNGVQCNLFPIIVLFAAVTAMVNDSN